MSLWRRLLGDRTPPDFAGTLSPGEDVVESAPVEGGGYLVVTPLGLWIPAGDGARRVGWHLIGKAAWSDGVFTLTESSEVGAAGSAVVLADLPPVRFRLPAPGKVPREAYQRVEGSIRSRHRQEIGSGGAWFVQRKVPGRDGSVLQVRPDPGTDVELVTAIAEQVAAKLVNPAE
ncbi:hypothetical protein SAMN05421837_106411 [Amycolatopsis pretoriensis]|uniref:Uncharacterized protein n=1 Tax=Amycolatopsis pretoriensis TaxID=218821 RepID=A0A1H5R3X7_9PSEU|nr:hypothetical protein [Amycolatopsis pretoriensis]SEF32754.1 hypothetical protein SAMN05421837_106411 [Amycolatopsis pretoriensis]